MLELKEAELPTLVWPEVRATNYGLSDDLMKHLETALRYDTHYSREFYRTVKLLLAMQTGGPTSALRACPSRLAPLLSRTPTPNSLKIQRPWQ
jgi:hypothetical protein